MSFNEYKDGLTTGGNDYMSFSEQEEQEIDINTDIVDHIIEKLDTALSLAQGEEGIEMFSKVRDLAEEKADGKAKDALVGANDKLMKIFQDNIDKVTQYRDIAIKYREFLKSGPSGRLVQNNNEIKLSPNKMQKSFDEYCEILTSEISTIKSNEETVTQDVSNMRTDLENTIARKKRHEPPLPTKEEEDKLAALNTNENNYNPMVTSEDLALDKINQKFLKLQEPIDVFKTELKLYPTLWNHYMSTQVDITTTTIAEYNEKFGGVNTVLKVLKLSKDDIISYINGEENSEEKIVQGLEDILRQLSFAEEENFLKILNQIFRGIRKVANEAMLEIAENPNYAEQRDELYAKYKNIEKLERIIYYLNQYTHEMHSTSATTEASNEIYEVTIDNGVLKIGPYPSKTYDLSILDSSQEIAYDFQYQESLAEQQGVMKALAGIGVVLGLTALTLSTGGTDLLGAMGFSVTESFTISKLTSLFIAETKLGKTMKEIDDNVKKQVMESVGCKKDSTGNYYVDFKPMLVIEEFELRGGELPTQEDLSSAENYNKWLGDSEDETTNHTFDVLDENGKETGETYENTNKEVLDTIIAEIEDDEPNSSTNKFHPGFGGFGMNES